MVRKLSIACLPFAFLMSGQLVMAAVITGVTVSGPGGFVPSVVIAAPAMNNDNSVGASPNFINIVKTMTDVSASPFDLSAAYLDFTFSVQDTGGVTEYFVTETVTNGSSASWLDFHHVLGFPVPDADSGFGSEPFTASGPMDDLDFDALTFDPVPSSPDFPIVSMHPDSLWWDSPGLPSGATTTFTFSLDIPDFNGFIPGAAAIPGGYEFTLRQWATVPEPSTYVIWSVLGLVGAGVQRRRRRRAA